MQPIETWWILISITILIFLIGVFQACRCRCPECSDKKVINCLTKGNPYNPPYQEESLHYDDEKLIGPIIIILLVEIAQGVFL